MIRFCLDRLFSLLKRGPAASAAGFDPGPFLTPLPEIDLMEADRKRDVPVTVKGSVIKVLRDDNEGERHQRFIVELENGRTLLVIHNIDISMRVDGISPGAEVCVSGDYLWNEHGGIIHWTHADPNGGHRPGWIVFDGRKYD